MKTSFDLVNNKFKVPQYHFEHDNAETGTDFEVLQEISYFCGATSRDLSLVDYRQYYHFELSDMLIICLLETCIQVGRCGELCFSIIDTETVFRRFTRKNTNSYFRLATSHILHYQFKNNNI